MRKIKARVKHDVSGTIAAAIPVGYSYLTNAIEEAWASEEDGYILVPLKKGTSRAKGNGLEREVAKIFSLWLYGEVGILTRTPLSGGFNGGKLGDISGDPAKLMEKKLQIPLLYCEAKNREGLLGQNFFNWLDSGTPKMLTELIEDTVKKAGLLHWFIILKDRGTRPWVFTLTKPGQSISDSIGMVLGKYTIFPLAQISNVYMYNNVKQEILGNKCK